MIDTAFKKIRCYLFGHDYHILRRINPGTRKLGCRRCGECFAMHDTTRSLIPWDQELEDIYAPGGPLDPKTDPRYTA
jgi:hypothetical protein